MPDRSSDSQIQTFYEERVDRILSGWSLVCALLLLPAIGLTLLAIGLTLDTVLPYSLQPPGGSVALSDLEIPVYRSADLFVIWASAIGASVSVYLAARRARL